MTTIEAPKMEFYKPTNTDLKNVNVLITIDAESIRRDFPGPGTWEAPVTVGKTVKDADRYISMMVRQGNVLENQRGSELNVKLEQKDHIHWRETTLSLNSDYVALLYAYEPHGVDKEIITPPKGIVFPDLGRPLPKPRKDGKEWDPGIQEISDYAWEATAVKKGSQQYKFKFMILKGKINKATKKFDKLGYYVWDPVITVEAG
jgi:hypothetical protein